jgi:hypothetical protein
MIFKFRIIFNKKIRKEKRKKNEYRKIKMLHIYKHIIKIKYWQLYLLFNKIWNSLMNNFNQPNLLVLIPILNAQVMLI